MMIRREIPRAEWVPFCHGFTGAHRGRLVAVDVHRDADGPHRVLCDRPLLLVQAGNGEVQAPLSIHTGEDPAQAETHVVESPRRLLLEVNDAGARQGLRIEGHDGVTTVVRFR